MAEHDVVFVEGVHYAIGKDGHADKTKPLRWEDGSYRPAVDGEPTHNEVHASAPELELDPGGEG